VRKEGEQVREPEDLLSRGEDKGGDIKRAALRSAPVRSGESPWVAVDHLERRVFSTDFPRPTARRSASEEPNRM